MKGKQSWSKAPLSVFRNKLSYEEFVENVRKLVPNLNQDASEQKFSEMYDQYISRFNTIEKTIASRIKLSTIGFFSSTQVNAKYWLDRGWNEEEALAKIKARQSTCTPEIAKKIQKTLSKKTDEEKAKINKSKGNGLSVNWLIKNKGLSLEEAEQHVFDRCSNAGKIKNELYRKLGKAVSNRQLDFYIERGLSLEDAKKALKERQSTTSLQAYIKKYGKTEGLRRYEQRINLFRKNWQNKSDDERVSIIHKKLKKNKFFSNESFEFFQELEKNYFTSYQCKYGENEWFLYDDQNKKIYFYDFLVVEKKMIVEYHGSFWHANLEKNVEDWKNSFYSYEESLKKDEEKRKLAEENGFTYKVVWDCQRNYKETIETILNIK